MNDQFIKPLESLYVGIHAISKTCLCYYITPGELMIEINSDFLFLGKLVAIYISQEHSTYLTLDLHFQTGRMYLPHHLSIHFEILSS